VSTLLRMIGAAIALSLVKGCGIYRSMVRTSAMAPDIAARSRRGRARQVGAGARPLAADEIAVGGRDRALAGRHGFAVGGEAHRTSGLAPLKPCVGEKLVEAFGNGVPLDGFRTRHHPGAHAGRDLAAARDLGGRAQIAQAGYWCMTR
jgi:hypothetical protein